MTESVDHYAKAVEMAAAAERCLLDLNYRPEEAPLYTRLGHLYLDLHHGQPQVVAAEDDPYWAQATKLENLLAAVRRVVEDAVHDLQREEYVIRNTADFDLLSRLVNES